MGHDRNKQLPIRFMQKRFWMSFWKTNRKAFGKSPQPAKFPQSAQS